MFQTDETAPQGADEHPRSASEFRDDAPADEPFEDAEEPAPEAEGFDDPMEDEAVEDDALEDDVPEDDSDEDSEDDGGDEAPAEEDGLAAAPACVRAALERRGFRELSQVQHAVAAADGAQRDLQISSQTGSGKTVAVGFAMADVLAEAGPHAGRGDGPTALVLCPTRELAGQVARELEWLYADLTGVDVAVVTGGTNVQFEVRRLHRGPRVVVGTPGRVLDHVTSGALDTSALREVVLDEADQMLDLGFRDELEAILDATPTDRRTHLVSATFAPGIQRIAERYQREPLHVEGTRLGEANQDIEHLVFLVQEDDRYAAIVNLLLMVGEERVLLFVNTRADASEIAEALSRDGFAAVPISGELAQSQRVRTLEAFRSGAVHVLVATDVAARGLDIPDVGTVLHAATPRDPETYTHRSGRTGRAGAKGRSLLMVPTRRERHVRRLLAGANVDASWRDVPTPDRVRTALAERERTRVLEAVEAMRAPTEHQCALATELLGGREPETVIAGLLTLVPSAARCEPLDLSVPAPWHDRKKPKLDRRRDRGDRYDDRRGHEGRRGRDDRGYDDRRGPRDRYDDRRSEPRHRDEIPRPERRPYGERDDRGGRPFERTGYGRSGERRDDRRGGYGREERRYDDRPPRYDDRPPRRDDRRPRDDYDRSPRHEDRGPQEGYVRYEVNWGGRHGANPRRVLAMVCRRGGFEGRAVGAIRIQGNSTFFEVAEREARQFDDVIQRPDERDPRMRIRRARRD